MNESALPQPEILQMKYRVMRSVEVIYLGVFKRICLQPLYKSTACGTVLCTTLTEYIQCIKERGTTELGAGTEFQLLKCSNDYLLADYLTKPLFMELFKCNH